MITDKVTLYGIYPFQICNMLIIKYCLQISVKPRLVISRPGALEDALLDGYLSHYMNEKILSLTFNLNSQGTLKDILDLDVKGKVK